MVVVSTAPPTLSGQLDVFHTTDPLLYNSPLLVFYGQAASVGSASSRIQVHIFTPAGLESYTRLSISPNSPYYAAVSALPREEQGDEACRGIAYALSKYFAELPQKLRDCWTFQVGTTKRPNSPFGLFSPTHIAILASRLVRVENGRDVAATVHKALAERKLSWLDADIVLPPGSVQPLDSTELEDATDDEICKRRYGKYAPIISALGEPAFLPTSKMRRAASKPTSVGRSATYRQGQKESIRKEMCELVDTEESYVQKLSQLSLEVGATLKELVDRDQAKSNDVKKALDNLFPASLASIRDRNNLFLTDLRAILDATEESAMQAIEEDTHAADQATDFNRDPLGVIALAKIILQHLPSFADDYAAYMEANGETTKSIRTVMSSTQQSLINAIHAFGEQKLTSLLIEPIQRLPRYTLYIDTIAKQLPVGHPALALLLKARDIVTNICLSENEEVRIAEVYSRLASQIKGFEANTDQMSRLVSVLDATRMTPPYTGPTSACQKGIFLLFTDRLIFVQKSSAKAHSAKSLQNEVEKPATPFSRSTNGSEKTFDLTMLDTYPLASTIITESADGKSVILTTDQTVSTRSHMSGHFLLEGAYSARTSRLVEEIAKARIEGRFAESEREAPTWDVRSAVGNSEELNIFSAVYAHGCASTFAGQIRIEIDLDRMPQVESAALRSEARFRITPGGNTFCHVAVDSKHGSINREKIAMSDLLPALARRMTPILQASLSPKESMNQAAIVAQNKAILEALDLILDVNENEVKIATAIPSPTKHSRPISPVKTLSSFLASKSANVNGPPMKRPDSTFTAVPNLQSRISQLPKPGSRENNRPSSKENAAQAKMLEEPSKQPASKFKRLEEILSTYLLAIQARKGNVVGRVLKARANAEAAEVNELYNALLEDPNMMVLAAQAPVDVLFAAFEKFLNTEWKARLGNVMDKSQLQAIQREAESRFPVDFEAFFINRYMDLSPQNQRALKGIVKLLAELLDGTGNDADRGILTTAFTELLIPNEDPIPFVSLMDRFVNDIEALFGEVVSIRDTDPIMSPPLGHNRSRSTNTGSLNSNTSSLRKKFGFGGAISRENSKSEHESKVGSVWRSLSKNKQGCEPSTPRGTVQRTRSTDTDVRGQVIRPSSSDRPAGLGAFPFERPSSQDSSFLLGSPLTTIGEHGTPGTGPPRKKRRSSLSDLSILQSPHSSPIRPSPASNRLDTITDGQGDPGNSTRLASPTRNPPRSRLPSSFRKENSPAPSTVSHAASARPRSSSKQPEDVQITAHSPGKGAITTSRPTSANKQGGTAPRVGLSERSSANAMKIKPSPTTSPEKPALTSPTNLPTPTRKLRIQSPQKIRERLQSEQRELQQTSSTLQDELSKIGDEIASLVPTAPGRLNGRSPSVRIGSKPITPPSTISVSTSSAVDLAKKLNELSTQITMRLDSLQEKNKSLQDETLSALVLSEARTKRLDELYREANAENEALYKRFNDELGKVVRLVRGGEGVEEVKRRLKGAEEEMEGLRRERARLRREVVGLRGRLGE